MELLFYFKIQLSLNNREFRVPTSHTIENPSITTT